MKHLNSQRIVVGLVSLLAVVSMLALAFFTASVSTVYAADENKALAQPTNKPSDPGKQPTKDATKETGKPETTRVPGKPTDVGKPENDRESGLYKRAATAIRENQIHIDFANKIVAKTQEWIDELKGKGKDVTALQAALTAFKAQIAVAQAANDEAKKSLQTHAGFDSNGQVTDRDQARQTVLKIAKDLRDVKKALDKATFDFRRAVTEARQDLKGDSTKVPTTPTPASTPVATSTSTPAATSTSTSATATSTP